MNVVLLLETGAFKIFRTRKHKIVDISQVQLAVVVDAGEPFIRKTHILEGDGLLSLDAYSHLQEVATAANDAYYSNVEAVAKYIAPNAQQRRAQLTTHAKNGVNPAVR